MSSVPLTSPQPLREQPVEPAPVHTPHEHRVGRALRHAPPVGDGHAGSVLALRLDLDVDVAVAGEGVLGEAGDHARSGQGGAVAAVSGTVEAFEDIGPGGDGLADGGAQAPHLLHPGVGGQGLGGDVGGYHDEGQVKGTDDLRRLGGDADGEPGGGGGWSQPRIRPRASARCPARGG
jgi:hypothetical protein